jgi:two-component system chemotaxis response regulator CheB
MIEGRLMRRKAVVVGASAGGVEALRTLVSGLPADLPVPVLVVLHIPPYGGSVLPAILSRASRLEAHHPVDGEPLRDGQILVAPPDRHLVVDGERVLLTRGPRENGHRPAVDVLFRSAARSLGPGVIGVILSGVLDDGTAGLAAIVRQGGAGVVQDPTDAMYPGMPRNAMAHTPVDHVVPVQQMAELIAKLCAEEVPDFEPPTSRLIELETDVAMMDENAINGDEHPGEPSGFSCPDCNGVLWEIRDGALVRYRCRVGHAWSAESLLGQQDQQLEGALWMALRGLEEKAALARKMGERASARDQHLSAQRFSDHAAEATQAASRIRAMLEAHVGSRDDGQTSA